MTKKGILGAEKYGEYAQLSKAKTRTNPFFNKLFQIHCHVVATVA